MYNFDASDFAPGSTYSRDAEFKIIDALLREPFFRKTQIHRLIANYPNSPNADKNLMIVKIMQSIWGKNETFDTFRTFDHFLSIPKRGHFIHQFEVFLLGTNVILAANEKGADLKKYFGFDSLSQVIYCWLFTSAAHDFGYPVESLDKILGKLSELYTKFGFETLCKKLDELKILNLLDIEPEFSKMLLPNEDGNTSCLTDIGEIVFQELCLSLDIAQDQKNRVRELLKRLIVENNHGYVSAILLYKSVMKDLGESANPQEAKVWMHDALRKAIAAVALHSLKIDDKVDDSFFIEKISFKKNPYAYLLFLIDNIQDWNRAGFPDIQETWADYFLDDFDCSQGHIHLRYRINHERWEVKDKRRVTEFLDYKRKMLNLIQSHSEPIGISVDIEFTNNIAEVYEPIKILL